MQSPVEHSAGLFCWARFFRTPRESSHRILSRPGWPDFVFAFHDGTEIGPRMLARIAKQTGLLPSDL
ncbi:MAG: type II toxin-antitoxin system HicA family toxin [Nitrospiraceae bacterium]|nr:type II toxin-antitoxin system HicA family toxin [Nitrospiraceae bacterium]